MKTARLPAFLVLTVALALDAAARSFDLVAWRGETVAALLPDDCATDELAVGTDSPVGIRIGVMKPVRYAMPPHSLERVEVCDRVVWGSEDGGPRVVEIAVSSDAKPKLYDFGTIRVRVIDRILPPASDWKYYLDIWQHPWAVSRYFKVKPFSREHYARMEPFWKMLATAGQKALTVSIVSRPWDRHCADAYESMIGRKRVRGADGREEWAFDYSVFDEYVAFGRACGIGPDIACYSMCPKAWACRYEDASGRTVCRTCKPGTPAFGEYWAPFLISFGRHLREKGWLKDTFIALDERAPFEVKETVELIRKCAPGLRFSACGNKLPAVYGATIDNFCMHLESVTDEYLKVAGERRAAGLTSTYYVCCSPNYPNTMLACSAGQAFWLGVYPVVSGLDGFLRWAWNSWPRDPLADASFGTWGAGDTFLVYPDGSPSWRFLELRNGISAAEKIRFLRDRNLVPPELEKTFASFNAQAALSGKMRFHAVRRDVMAALNPERPPEKMVLNK